MGGWRGAGPLGISLLTDFDTGTLCRTESPVPGSVSIACLSLDTALVDGVHDTLLRVRVAESLRRGAREADLALLQAYHVAYQQLSPMSRKGTSDPVAVQLLKDRTQWLIEREIDTFSSLLTEELGEMPVGLVAAGGPIEDADDYRYRVRPLYYSFGYREPGKFLKRQRLHRVLGKSATWIHEDLAAVLDRLPGILNEWSPNLAAETAKEIGGVLGLQIRRIAGKEALSNHAFGCAVDVDALSNPHVTGFAVIDVFNWAARKGGVSFDFGKGVLTREERGHSEYTIDDILEIHNRAVPASDAVRDWLVSYLPRFRRLMTQIEADEKDLQVHPKPSAKMPLVERLTKDEAAAQRAPSKPAPGQVKSVDRSATLESIRRNINEILMDQDLIRIQILHENFDLSYINTWERRGVLTMPLYLAAALVGRLKLRWGEQYEGSKDGMHFELLNGTLSYISPQDPLSRGEKPRTLARLMDEAFKAALPAPARRRGKH